MDCDGRKLVFSTEIGLLHKGSDRESLWDVCGSQKGVIKHLFETQTLNAVWLQSLHYETLSERMDLHTEWKLYVSVSDVNVGLNVIAALQGWFATEKCIGNNTDCPIVYLSAVALLRDIKLNQLGSQVVRSSTDRCPSLAVADQLG